MNQNTKVILFSLMILNFLVPSSNLNYARADDRKTKIEFEETSVENAGQRKLSSVESISNEDRSNQKRLYQRKKNFNSEIKQQTKDMGYNE